jgi:CheY-like chemotaxis protein
MALILIVDDESPVRQLLTRWIQGAGHETAEADSADTALEVMEKRPAAVVFCDVQMPKRDGLWLTNELRARYRHTAIVLATSVSTIAPPVSMQAGVLAYLVKPFGRSAVTDALDVALAWHKDAMATGPRSDHTPERLQEWLDSLDLA